MKKKKGIILTAGCLLFVGLFCFITVNFRTSAVNNVQARIQVIVRVPGVSQNSGSTVEQDFIVTDPKAVAELQRIVDGPYIRTDLLFEGRGYTQTTREVNIFFVGDGDFTAEYCANDRGLLDMNGKEYVPLFWSSKKKIYSQLAEYVEQLPEKAAVFLRFCFLIQGTGV